MKKSILVLIVFFLFCISVDAQNKQPDHDTTRYISYREKLTGRVYFSRKYTSLKLTPPDDELPTMKYLANTKLIIGVGATYRALTLNIGIGVTAFNPDYERGETHYVDLQTHYYARKWNFDLLGQFYRGYYLTPKGLGSSDNTSYYIRNDLGVQLGGVGAYRALNDKKFSYQAGLVQNEWQKKSAGSILIGAEAYYGAIQGDSVLVPGSVDPAYENLGIRKVHFFEAGPGIGYAYTLVIAEHFFILASATVGIDFRYTREIEDNSNADKADITPNLNFHAGAGYNAEKWDLSLLWVGDQIHVEGAGSGYKYRMSTGNYRLIYARRFSINRKVKKMLQPINDLMENK